MATPAGEPARAPADTAAARASAQGRIRWELLSLLVRKDLKVKYQGSALGFVWSLANPLLQLGIYFVIFTKILPNGVPQYALYLMAGLLPFVAFSQAVSGAAASVVSGAGLVKKVRFPRLVLPLSAVGFALVQLALQLGLLLVVVAVFETGRLGPQLLLLMPALALLVLFATALGVLVSALNVRWRDTSHFVEIAMLIWFWANPILYPAGFAKRALGDAWWAYFLNPMATVVSTVQRALYEEPYYQALDGTRALVLAAPGYSFYLRNLAIGFAIAGALMALALYVFNRLQADFAEEL